MNTETTSFFLKTSYYRSFAFIIGGIAGLIFSFHNLTKTINDFPVIEGKISVAHLRWNDSPYSIKLNKNTDSWYRIYNRKMFPILQKKVIAGKRATIWYNKDNIIMQLKVDGELIYPYKKTVWLWVLLILFSLILSIGNIIYIVKNRDKF